MLMNIKQEEQMLPWKGPLEQSFWPLTQSSEYESQRPLPAKKGKLLSVDQQRQNNSSAHSDSLQLDFKEKYLRQINIQRARDNPIILQMHSDQIQRFR